MTDAATPVGHAATSDDRRFPTMPQTGNPVPARPYFSHRHQRNAAIIGGVTAFVVAVSDVYLVSGGLFATSSLGVVAFFVSLVGVPVAIATLIACGTQTRRYRPLLIVAGLVLLVSPFIGVLIGAAMAGQPAFDLN